MLYGYDNLVKDFKRLADSRRLSHAYLFFGEPQTGKFLFAVSLANYIENGVFDEPKKFLGEALIIDFGKNGDSENKESVGIDKVRELERFLYQTPIASPYRIAIIRDAEWLTDQAQNALLKVLEEPPSSGLIIITARDKAVFLPTVTSRMQGIYFKTLPRERVLDFLEGYDRISHVQAKTVSQESYGRIGRALELIKKDDRRSRISSLVKSAVSGKNTGKRELEATIDELLKIFDKAPALLEIFFEEISGYVKKYGDNNPSLAGDINQEMLWLQSLTAQKRIHLKYILWATQSLLSHSSSSASSGHISGFRQTPVGFQ